jgi:hypothetical protein
VNEINRTTKDILAKISKPPNRGREMLDIAAAGVGVASVVSIIETILNWIRG